MNRQGAVACGVLSVVGGISGAALGGTVKTPVEGEPVDVGCYAYVYQRGPRAWTDAEQGRWERDKR